MERQLAGIGVGVANLSLASLLCSTKITNAFFDRNARFDWHGGMQIKHTSLQVSLFKDLVTLSDPTSPFSFLAYLHASRRIYHFLNARFDAVTRKEFSLYLEWAANRNPNVYFGEEVLDVDFDGHFVVTTNKREVRSEHIAVGVGKTPKIPAFAKGKVGLTQFHSSSYLWNSDGLAGKRVAIVGGGQSGAEIFLDLISRDRTTMPIHTSWISRRTCYWPIDDSAFTNDLFMPCHQSYFASMDELKRRQFLRENVLASDGISVKTLQSIYQTLYLNKFVYGLPDLVSLLPNREVTHESSNDGAWRLCLQHRDHDAMETVDADVVIWATGYEDNQMGFMERIAGRIDRVGQEFKVDGNFAASWDGPSDRCIFIQNASHVQRGLADPNLSLLAWRSERIIERLTGVPHPNLQIPSMITWAPKEPALEPEAAETTETKTV